MANLQSVNSIAGKETIYVDVDDEITAIIDKVGAAKGKIVALVLPKRCPVLQSVVNMKLLKRSADNAGKNLVLVTSEAGLLPLAGATGMYVASTPTSKPMIPAGPSGVDDAVEDVEEPLKIVDGNSQDSDGDGDDFDTKASSSKSVGELNAGVKKSSLTPVADDDTIDMADDADEELPIAAADKPPKQKKNKSLKVPNFNKFRVMLMVGAAVLVLLIVGIVVALNVLPKATITIGTDSNTIPTNLTLTLDTSEHQLDAVNNIVPATSQTQQKSNSATVQATGQQNNGQKASGTVTLNQSVCAPNLGNSPAPVSAGSTVSSGNSTFVVQQGASYSQQGFHGGSCVEYSTGAINILALNGGASYNVSSGSSFSGPNGATGTGSASGGTDNITTIVQQSDITSAQNKAATIDTSGVKQELEQSLEAQGLDPVPATFLAGTPQSSANQQVGAAASNVTVTATISYSMLGVKKSDLQTLVDNNVNGQLDKGKQVILDDGVEKAEFAEPNAGTASSATVAMTVSSMVGPQLNVTALKTQLAGKKSADVQSYIKQTPGVTNVSVKFGPFWVDSVPSKASKVQINIVKAGS